MEKSAIPAGTGRAAEQASAILEVPSAWLSNPLDGAGHRLFFASLLTALARRNVVVRLRELPFGADEAPRIGEDGVAHFSFHSIGPAVPGLIRLKESPIAGYYGFDELGYSGSSSLAVEPERHRPAIAAIDGAAAERRVRAIATRAREANRSKYPQPERRTPPAPGYVFLPLQTVEDPVTRFFRMPIDTVVRSAAEAARPDRRLVVKRHPLCRSPLVDELIEEIRRRPNVEIREDSIHDLVDGADFVLVGNSGVGFEALMAGRPAVSWAASEYESVCTSISDTAGLRAAFDCDTAAYDPLPAWRFLDYVLTRRSVALDDVERIGRLVEATLSSVGRGAGAVTSEAARLAEEVLRTTAAVGRVERELQAHRALAHHDRRLLDAARAEVGDLAGRVHDAFRQASFAQSLCLRAARDIVAAAGAAAEARAALCAAHWRLPIEVTHFDAGRTAKAASADYYQKLHDEDAGFQQNNWLTAHVATLLGPAPRRVVELGCGNGHFLRAISPWVEQAIGLDWALAPAVRSLPANVSVEIGDARQMPLPHGDICCSADVLEHFTAEDLEGFVPRLHAAAPINYHVIALYDDGHSHLTVASASWWLDLFARTGGAYRLIDVLPRRGRADQMVVTITNAPQITAPVDLPAGAVICGALVIVTTI